MINAYLNSWKNYANFNDRASRSDYWLAFLGNTLIWVALEILIIVTSVLTTISGLFNIAFYLVYFLSVIYSLAYFIPSLSIMVRRLHDQDKSALFMLLELIPFCWSNCSLNSPLSRRYLRR